MVLGPGCHGSGARLSWYWGQVVMVLGPGCHGSGLCLLLLGFQFQLP